MLLPHAGVHRACFGHIERRRYARAGTRRRLAARNTRPLPEEQRRSILAGIPPWLRVRGQPAAPVHLYPFRTTKRFCGSSISPMPPDWRNWAPAVRTHFLRTKIKPLYVDWNPQTEDAAALRAKAEGRDRTVLRVDYAAHYTSGAAMPIRPRCGDPNPTVVLIPGLGNGGLGKRQVGIAGDCGVLQLRRPRSCAGRAPDRPPTLPCRSKEDFDIEYWLLEECKLKRPRRRNSPVRSLSWWARVPASAGKRRCA